MNIFKRNKKINFEKEDLVLCRIALITDYKVLAYGTRFTSWDYQTETTWRILPEIRILIRGDSERYYEPNDYFNLYEKREYQKGHEFLREGERFVKQTDNMPIQYIANITLTQKELKTKKISLKRIKEIEDLLNSNLQN